MKVLENTHYHDIIFFLHELKLLWNHALCRTRIFTERKRFWNTVIPTPLIFEKYGEVQKRFSITVFAIVITPLVSNLNLYLLNS